MPKDIAAESVRHVGSPFYESQGPSYFCLPADCTASGSHHPLPRAALLGLFRAHTESVWLLSVASLDKNTSSQGRGLET